MIDFDEVMQRLKSYLLQNAKKEKIRDKEIATALNLSPQYYAVIKKRKKIPYEAIAYFAQTHKLNMNWLLLAQTPKEL
jgi:hypothetical protein